MSGTIYPPGYTGFINGGLPAVSPQFVGVPTATLQQWQAEAQVALHAVNIGQQVQVAMYGEGTGSKSVTFTRTNAAQLRQYLAELTAALGGGGRRAIPVRF